MEDPRKSATLMWGGLNRGAARGAGVGMEGSAGSRSRRAQTAQTTSATTSTTTTTAVIRHRGDEHTKTKLRRLLNAARMEAARANETPLMAAERRARNAAAMQAARARETPRQRAARRAQNAARMERLRATETPEQAAARRALNAARMQAARAREDLSDAARAVGLEGACAGPYVLVGGPATLQDAVVVNANAQQGTVNHRHQQQLQKQLQKHFKHPRDLDDDLLEREHAEGVPVKVEPSEPATDGGSRKRTSFARN